VVTPLESNPERLIGYVLTGSVEALENSGQVPPIREFCRRRNHQLIYVEPETGSSTTLLRQGLWHAVRSLVCYKCAAKDMPVSIDTPEWLKQVFEICPCGEPEGLDGLVVATMGASKRRTPHIESRPARKAFICSTRGSLRLLLQSRRRGLITQGRRPELGQSMRASTLRLQDRKQSMRASTVR
jgi:hypothetical protein